MNKSKSIAKAKIWVNQKPLPKELSPSVVWSVLEGLGFKLIGENSDHTARRWSHSCLLANKDYFKYCIIKIAVGHSKGQKTVVRVDSIKKLINALNIYLESNYEKD